ncbi:MAG: hypothetical protein M3R51_09370 [Candidatus Eremiobacteraeota bacterium]|nr:hypothetical protein [Candidatus Eremiobacteraeota bacterium]
MRRYFEAVLSALFVFVIAAAPAHGPNVALRLTGSIVSFAHGKEMDAPLNRPVHGGEIVRYTIVARNVGTSAAYRFSPVGRVPLQMQLLKVARMPNGSRVSYSVDGSHWTASFKTNAAVRSVRWELARPLAPRANATFAYEVRVK